jgi:glycosyltransferase involved in cell wall biosynthesis
MLNRRHIHTDVMTFNMDKRWNPRWHGEVLRTDGFSVFKIPALNWLPMGHSNRVTLGINVVPGRFTNILKNYDIIHFHELEFSFPLFSSLQRKKKIIHLHAMDASFLERYDLSRVMLRRIPDLIITVSNKMKKDLVTLGIPASMVVNLPNSVDTSFFEPTGQKENNLLLFVGRITPEKGLNVLLDSLKYLKEPVHLVVIGPAWNSDYYQKVLKRIEEENRTGQHEITYLGPLEQADMVSWYQKASLFILPSSREAFPVTILEALSCATPVIATPVGGIPEIIENFRNGILVPINNPERLGEAIQYLLKNEKNRTELGLVGRRLVVEKFSIEKTVSKLQRIYEQLLS